MEMPTQKHQDELVNVPGGSLWTTRQGNGPALVCCHGGPGLWDYLAPVAEMIEDLVTVYRYDQRACGRSTGGPSSDVATAIADLDALRDHWELPQWIILGHSWGASLALAYSLIYGHHIPPSWQEELLEEALDLDFWAVCSRALPLFFGSGASLRAHGFLLGCLLFTFCCHLPAEGMMDSRYIVNEDVYEWEDYISRDPSTSALWDQFEQLAPQPLADQLLVPRTYQEHLTSSSLYLLLVK